MVKKAFRRSSFDAREHLEPQLKQKKCFQLATFWDIKTHAHAHTRTTTVTTASQSKAT